MLLAISSIARSFLRSAHLGARCVPFSRACRRTGLSCEASVAYCYYRDSHRSVGHRDHFIGSMLRLKTYESGGWNQEVI